MTATATKAKPMLFSAPMVRAILEGRKTQTRRIIKPQPPSIEDVYAKSGYRPYGWFRESTDTDNKPFRPVGPVWAVRELNADMANKGIKCPYGTVGSELWVREKLTRGLMPHIITGEPTIIEHAIYAADGNPCLDANGFDLSPWWQGMSLPSIHMPRAVSRITLRITGIRVERVQDITEEDAKAEGVEPMHLDDLGQTWKTYLRGFQSLWESIHDRRPKLPHNINSKRYSRIKNWLEKNPPVSTWAENSWVWVVSFEKV